MAQRIEYQDLVVKNVVSADKLVKNNTNSNYLLTAGGGAVNPESFISREYFDAYTISTFDEIGEHHENYLLDYALSKDLLFANVSFPSDWKVGKISLTLEPMVYQKGCDYNIKVAFADYMKATGARLFIENDLTSMVGASTLIKIIIDNNVIIVEAYVEG